MFVSALWPFALANALLSAERRKRITVAQATGFLTRIGGLPVAIDPPQIPRAFDQILAVARQQNLTVYDAAYLELAMRRDLPLATLDNALRQAAVVAGMKLIA